MQSLQPNLKEGRNHCSFMTILFRCSSISLPAEKPAGQGCCRAGLPGAAHHSSQPVFTALQLPHQPHHCRQAHLVLQLAPKTTRTCSQHSLLQSLQLINSNSSTYTGTSCEQFTHTWLCASLKLFFFKNFCMTVAVMSSPTSEENCSPDQLAKTPFHLVLTQQNPPHCNSAVHKASQ